MDGSDINMGCTSQLVDTDGVMICMSQNYLVDGCSPAIETSTSDWASQLVTVRKTQNDRVTDAGGDPFDHVLLTFGFDTAVRLTEIELDLFLCPDMNINAPFITLYVDEESNLTFTHDSSTSLPFQSYPPGGTVLPTSCDSLSTITITLSDILTDPYITWHILFSSFTSSIDWVYVGEVRLLESGSFPGTVLFINTVLPDMLTIIAGNGGTYLCTHQPYFLQVILNLSYYAPLPLYHHCIDSC